VTHAVYPGTSVYRLIPFLVFLGACARQPEAPAAAPAQPVTAAPAAPVATPADSRPVIVAFGDSLSAGYGVDAGLSYPDFLQKEIDAAGFSYRVVNQGISGDTTTGGAGRTASAIELKPEIVILELGGNDGLRGVPLAATRANMESMTRTFLDAGARVVIAGMTLPPNYGPDYVREFESIFRDIATSHKLPRIPFLLEPVALNPTLMQRDGIHPTAEGNRRVASHVMKTLRPLLRKGR